MSETTFVKRQAENISDTSVSNGGVEDKDVFDQVIKTNHLSSAKQQPLIIWKTASMDRYEPLGNAMQHFHSTA
jgi:hypothetical protein